jgi:hypothetical protein
MERLDGAGIRYEFLCASCHLVLHRKLALGQTIPV